MESPPTTQPKQWRRWILTLVLTGLVVFVLVRHISGVQGMGDTFRQARWNWFWLPMVWMTINVLIAGVRWHLIVSTMGYNVSYGRILYAMLATWPLALITPSRASDILRAWAIRDKVPLAQGAGTVISEKIIDLQSLGIYTLLGSLFSGLWLWGATALAALFSLWFLVYLLLTRLDWILSWKWLQKRSEMLRRFFQVFTELKNQPRRFFLICGFSLLGWAGAIGITTSLLWIFRANIPTSQVVTLWPIALFLAYIPITLAGMGTRDAVFISLVWISSQTMPNQSNLLAGTFTYALVTTVYPSILGLPLMFRFLHELRKPQPVASENNDHEPGA